MTRTGIGVVDEYLGDIVRTHRCPRSTDHTIVICARGIDQGGVGGAGIGVRLGDTELGCGTHAQGIVECDAHTPGGVCCGGVEIKQNSSRVPIAVDTALVNVVHRTGKGRSQAVQRRV